MSEGDFKILTCSGDDTLSVTNRLGLTYSTNSEQVLFINIKKKSNGEKTKFIINCVVEWLSSVTLIIEASEYQTRSSFNGLCQISTGIPNLQSVVWLVSNFHKVQFR